MSRRFKGLTSAGLSITAILVLSGCVFAQATQQEEQQKSVQEKKVPVQVVPDSDASDAEFRDAIKALTDQIKNLSTEVRRLRRANELSVDSMRLVLYEDRLDKVDDDINAANAHKTELDSAEQTVRYRMANIQQELIVRGGLNREDSEEAIRSDLERSLQNIHAQQAANQKRLADLHREESLLQSKINSLKKKLGLDQESDDGQK